MALAKIYEDFFKGEKPREIGPVSRPLGGRGNARRTASKATQGGCARLGVEEEKSRRRDQAPRRPNENLHAALPRVSHFMPTHLLFSIGFKAPNAFGSPQYLAPVAHTMR